MPGALNPGRRGGPAAAGGGGAAAAAAGAAAAYDVSTRQFAHELKPPRRLRVRYSTGAEVLNLKHLGLPRGALFACADQGLVSDWFLFFASAERFYGSCVGHHALAPHCLKNIEGTGWLSARRAGANQSTVGD